MANTAGVCNSFKTELLNGIHAFGPSVVRASTTKDTFYGALYLASATISASTTAYSATGEVTGTGYTATGQALTTATAPVLSGSTACFTPSGSLTWTGVTLATAFDTLLVYNQTSATKAAVAVYTFGSQTVSAGNFTLTMPTNDASNALLRIA